MLFIFLFLLWFREVKDQFIILQHAVLFPGNLLQVGLIMLQALNVLFHNPVLADELIPFGTECCQLFFLLPNMIQTIPRRKKQPQQGHDYHTNGETSQAFSLKR